MSLSERRKGVEAEREVAKIFRSRGYVCDRVPNSGGLRMKGDLNGTVPLHIEVKRQERARPFEWLRQAESEAPPGIPPVVVFRQSGGRWYAMLPLADLLGLLPAPEA